MASIKVIQRKVNKGIDQPVNVRYNHPDATGKRQDYFIPVGLSLSPDFFRAGLVVNHPLAPETNETIGKIVTRLRVAVRNVSATGQEPTVERVKRAYLSQPALVEKIERLTAHFYAEGKQELEILEHELAQLHAQVDAKKAEILALRQQLGDHQEESFVALIDEFISFRQALAKKTNTKKRSKTSFAATTKDSYTQLQKEINVWKPALNIREVTAQTLNDFESYMIGRRYFNSTTFVFMQKFSAVLNHFQESYQLDKDFRTYTCELPQSEETVIYLTRDELRGLREVSAAHPNPVSARKRQEVKDLALLMSETGLRYADAALTRGDIKGSMIHKRQRKTGRFVYIPLTSRVREILDRHNYQLRGKSVRNWNENFRKLLHATGVPSLMEDVTVVNFIGDEEVYDTRPKWAHCSAHTLRRTMINQCLLRNLRYDKITKMTGHKNFDVFQTYVDSNTNAGELDSVFDYLDDTALLDGVGD